MRWCPPQRCNRLPDRAIVRPGRSLRWGCRTRTLLVRPPWRAKTSSEAVRDNAFRTGEFSASSTAPRLAPVTTKNSTAGRMDIGSRPASEAAARTVSSRCA